jgi:hypothetical protein
MALAKALRDEVRKKLNGISDRQLYNKIGEKTIEAGVADHDLALLLIAHEKRIDVAKPRFSVPPSKLQQLDEYLKSRRTGLHLPIVVSSAQRKGSKAQALQGRKLLKFKGKYPDIFYDRLEEEINTAHSDPRLPNATLMLSRKLIENLVYNLLQYKFKGPGINLYFDTKHNRPQDFGVLLDNLKKQRPQFDADLHDSIDKLLQLAQPFRLDANSKVHNIIEYLDSPSQLKKMKIPEMAQLLLRMIDRVK